MFKSYKLIDIQDPDLPLFVKVFYFTRINVQGNRLVYEQYTPLQYMDPDDREPRSYVNTCIRFNMEYIPYYALAVTVEEWLINNGFNPNEKFLVSVWW